jgi:hypothetical protein
MKNLSCLFLICAFFFSFDSDADQKKREQEIADSVAKALTGKSINDAENIEKMKRVKNDSAARGGVIKADAAGLRNIRVECDYDNKLFNKKSDIDGKLFNNSASKTYKNITLKVVCKDKKGNVVKTFTRIEAVTLSPGSSHKLRIKFEDAEKTRNATVTIIGAEEIL